ncbi:transcription repressor NadR [Vagococcus intermedius]|uniref:Transcription repressor NadR n=1 Tax=Vagococcus intermedius TaxID=2991418 RepID=A0AAF0CUU3_9ENTE|nr:transcription repressor NadR [Vagococcus intermedius]WEG73272.1 transcription repressor NadR [Vagococcus intermedius]WEG75354.1 transcription repressor NadR [Vagococcus intermedius]
MLKGNERREKIISCLTRIDQPVSASVFAKEFGVSRQVVVGDIALLRAAAHPIQATSRGYVLIQNDLEIGKEYKIVCKHLPEETSEELFLLVDLGVEIKDVSVEHQLYGEIVGNLSLKSKQDVSDFLTKAENDQVTLLSDLTGGVHLHTIRCRDGAHFLEVKRAMRQATFLYEDN